MSEPRRVLILWDHQVERAQHIWVGVRTEDLIRERHLVPQRTYVIRHIHEMEWVFENFTPPAFIRTLRQTWTPLILAGTPIITEGYGPWCTFVEGAKEGPVRDYTEYVRLLELSQKGSASLGI